MVGMPLRCHLGVMLGVQVMTLRGVCMLGCFRMMALVVGLGGMTMMRRGMIVMLGGLFVMFGDLVRVRHFYFPCRARTVCPRTHRRSERGVPHAQYEDR
jgi:hypothetical protein